MIIAIAKQFRTLQYSPSIYRYVPLELKGATFQLASIEPLNLIGGRYIVFIQFAFNEYQLLQDVANITVAFQSFYF